MSIVIHKATLADATALARIHKECFDEAWDETSFRRFLEQDNIFAFLGNNADANQSQAFILSRVTAEEAEILSLGTVPAARRFGLAAALLQYVAREAACRHASVMFLEVAEDNKAALALYESYGFMLAGRRPSYYSRAAARAVDALLLRRALPICKTMGMKRRLD